MAKSGQHIYQNVSIYVVWKNKNQTQIWNNVWKMSKCRIIVPSFLNLVYLRQARAEGGGAEGAWAPAPLPKVPFCQGNYYYLFLIF